jgi:hypothetical protein
VLGVFAGLLWSSGFFRAEEIAVLQGLRRPRPAVSPASAPEATELGGEIIAADVSGDRLEAEHVEYPRSR